MVVCYDLFLLLFGRFMIKLFDFEKFVKTLFNKIVQCCSRISIVQRRYMFETRRISSFAVHYNATLFDNFD